ncbi:hypothetical protein Misp05_44100 [Micromonospora sp. NBRC 107095]|nr:hypothetical protein Misp05_44100 [Micromonospora sp. NBRC 107095]
MEALLVGLRRGRRQGQGEQSGFGFGEDLAGDEAFELGAEILGVRDGGAGTEGLADRSYPSSPR